MEELDFNSLFEASSGDYAGGVLERLFGGIIPFLKGEAASPGTNWLSEMFTIFNMVGFIGVMIISSYTIYTVIFDTAADGKTFGQQADTKYTLMRILGGAIAFIPVTGGYSVAQVVLLWLMIQASALGDVVWTRTAEASLSAQPLLSAPTSVNLADIPIQRQFAEAFDALVLGHICAYNANDIKLTLDGNSNVGDRRSGPMTLRSLVTEEQRPQRSWTGSATGRVDVSRTHQMFFSADDGDTSYSGRDNFCGGVTHGMTVTTGTADAGVSFNEAVVSVQRNERFNTYQTVMGTMAGRAADVAWRVFANNERDAQVLEDLSRNAVRQAVTSYLSGVQDANSIDSSTLSALNDSLLDRATAQGWMFAPSWQRGIALSAASGNAVADDFTIQSDRRFAVTDYLSRGERRSDVGRSMLAMAEDDRVAWDMMTPTIASLGEPEEADNYRPLDGNDEGIELDSITSWIYEKTLGLLSVRGGAYEESAIVTDPMVEVTQYGQGMMTIGAVIEGSRWVINGASSFFGGVAGGTVASNITGPLKAIAWGFIAVGFVIAFIIPLIPFAYFYSAVVSWFLLILEAFFAVPLAVLTLFAPAREGTLIGSWNKILLSIFGIVLRPLFTIVGMIVSMMVISFALSYLYDMFYGMVALVTPNGLWGLLGMFGFLFIFMLLTLYTVLIGSSLITELGDGAMNWLGIGISSLSQKMDMGGALRAGINPQAAITGSTIGAVSKAGNALPKAQKAAKLAPDVAKRAIGRIGRS